MVIRDTEIKISNLWKIPCSWFCSMKKLKILL